MSIWATVDLNFFDLCATQDSSRSEEQDDDEQRKRDRISIGGKSRAADECFHNAKDDSTDRRSGNISNSAKHRCNKRF